MKSFASNFSPTLGANRNAKLNLLRAALPQFRRHRPPESDEGPRCTGLAFHGVAVKELKKV